MSRGKSILKLSIQKKSSFLKLYLIDMALNLDFRDSENDWRSDGPAPSWFDGEECRAGLLQTDKNF